MFCTESEMLVPLITAEKEHIDPTGIFGNVMTPPIDVMFSSLVNCACEREREREQYNINQSTIHLLTLMMICSLF